MARKWIFGTVCRYIALPNQSAVMNEFMSRVLSPPGKYLNPAIFQADFLVLEQKQKVRLACLCFKTTSRLDPSLSCQGIFVGRNEATIYHLKRTIGIIIISNEMP